MGYGAGDEDGVVGRPKDAGLKPGATRQGAFCGMAEAVHGAGEEDGVVGRVEDAGLKPGATRQGAFCGTAEAVP